MPNTYYSTVLPGVAGGPSIQATFVDENPFIIAYNATTNKYHSPYYVAHVRPSASLSEVACAPASPSVHTTSCASSQLAAMDPWRPTMTGAVI